MHPIHTWGHLLASPILIGNGYVELGVSVLWSPI
jgi:hypothetical protein